MSPFQLQWWWIIVGVLVADGILIPLVVQATMLATAHRRRYVALTRFRAAGLSAADVAQRDQELAEQQRQAEAALRRWRKRLQATLVTVVPAIVYPSLLTVGIPTLLGVVLTDPLRRAAWQVEVVRAERDGLFWYQMWLEQPTLGSYA